MYVRNVCNPAQSHDHAHYYANCISSQYRAKNDTISNSILRMTILISHANSCKNSTVNAMPCVNHIWLIDISNTMLTATFSLNNFSLCPQHLTTTRIRAIGIVIPGTNLTVCLA